MKALGRSLGNTANVRSALETKRKLIDDCKQSRKRRKREADQQQVRWAVDGRRDNNFTEEEERKTKIERSES